MPFTREGSGQRRSRINQLVLFADATYACYEIGDKELIASPGPAKVIVTSNNWTKVYVGWSVGPSEDGCWPWSWRLALVYEDSFPVV
jgi:hypothetical protein